MENSNLPIELLIKIMTKYEVYQIGLCCRELSKELKNYTYILINKRIDDPNIQNNIIGKKIFHKKKLPSNDELEICYICNIKGLKLDFKNIIYFKNCEECKNRCCSGCRILFHADDNNDEVHGYNTYNQICKICFDNNENYHCKICNKKQEHFNFMCHKCNDLFCDTCYINNICKYKKVRDQYRWNGDDGYGKGPSIRFENPEDEVKYYYKCNDCIEKKYIRF